ncbi:hypothetical protein AB0O14_19185 [Microbacterium foliorum]|uniref:hypothetical protein n=1 Tax=Rothia terrae TaxID=396015 RepID=UPI003447C069
MKKIIFSRAKANHYAEQSMLTERAKAKEFEEKFRQGHKLTEREEHEWRKTDQNIALHQDLYTRTLEPTFLERLAYDIRNIIKRILN